VCVYACAEAAVNPMASEDHLQNYSGVTVVSQWCYRGVAVVVQWCYSGVTVVLQ
jgi:hypothetical protein